MTQIKFEMALDANNPKQLKAFATFLNTVADLDPTAPSEAVKTEEAKTDEPAPAPAKTASKNRGKNPAKTEEAKVDEPAPKEEAKTEEAKVDEPAPKEEAKTEEAKVESTLSLADIREVLSTKVTAHREAILEKLKGLGAKNINALEPANFDEFYTFLTALK